MQRVFDIHTHTYPEAIAERAVESLGQFYNFVPEGKGTYADLSAHGKEHHIGGFLLFSVATNAHQVEKVNTTIAALAEKSRAERYLSVAFAGMHQDYPDFEAELNRATSLGLCGVKIHPDIQRIDIDDPKLFPLYELMQGKLPLYLHMGDPRPEYRFSEAKKLCHVLALFPRLEVVCAHLGGYRAHTEAIEYLAGRENIWYDTSSTLWWCDSAEASRIIGKLGSERVMFGSDYPVKYPEVELELFSHLTLTDAQREDILWNNAIRFLHLEDKQ